MAHGALPDPAAAALLGVVDRLQSSDHGSAQLDGLIEAALGDPAWESTAWESTAWDSTAWDSTASDSTASDSTACDETGRDGSGAIGLLGRLTQRAEWSTDLSHALFLLPRGYNYSLGQRDGVCWAWIAPNDDWAPAGHEHRQDHPGGSGLVVARTAALALTCAALVLRINRRPAAR